jgi:iron(III) transport system substrate-binding protein
MRRKNTSLVAFYCLAFWHFGLPWAFGQSEHTTRLIEGAKKEGKLVWYTSIALPESKPLLDAFEKKYPFVKTELFRAGLESTVNRIRTETQAGRWEFDAVAINGRMINILAQHKLISPYVSPEAKAYNPELKNRDGSWTGISNNYFVIGYNTGQVSEPETPKRWRDLLDPKWRGKISVDREQYEWYATLLGAWGRERAQKYMQDFAKQQIQWRRGHTLIAQLMAAGEFPLAIVYAHRIEDMKKKGAPVEWVNTTDPIVASVTGIGISARPNNPNIAKLFIDFVLSKKGQEMIRSFNRIPARLDVEPLSPRMDQAKLKLKVVPPDMETRYKEYGQEFRRIFGL